MEIVGGTQKGEEALRLASQHTPDILLLDAQLPDASGQEVTRRLKETGSPVRVVVLADQVEDEQVFELLASGASGFVTRKDDPEVVFEAIRAVARGDEIWISPRVAAKLVPRRGKASEASGLTAREREILQRLAWGQRNEQIAEALHLTEGTVRNHLSSIYAKLGIHSRSEAVAWAWRNGLVQL